ncbi:MAG: hypothetical protein AAF938_12680 [Myxococcota bacterium]
MKHALLVVLVLSACADVAEPAFELRPVVDGRFDQGASLLSADDLARIEDALNDIVRRGEAEVRELERELRSLNADNDAKRGEIAVIARRIDDREDELEDRHNDNLILCAFFPSPECFLASYLANDSRLRRFREERRQAEAEQRRIAAAIESHDDERGALEDELDGIRIQRDRILRLLRRTLTASGPTDAQREFGPEVLQANRLREGVSDVAATFHQETRVLRDLIDNAVRLQAVLNRGLATLERLDEDMAALVADAEKAFMNAFEAAIAGNLEQHASAYLERQLHTRARRALRAFGIRSDVLVDYLVENRMPTYDEALEELLRSALSDDTLPEAGPLLLTQIIDGEGHDKMVEVSNAGTLPFQTAGCVLEIYSNGSEAGRAVFAFDGELEADESFVVCGSRTSEDWSGACDGYAGGVNHNGNDVYVLSCDDAVVDSVGQVGSDAHLADGESFAGLRRGCEARSGDADPFNAWAPDSSVWSVDPISLLSGSEIYVDLGSYGCW